MASGRAERIIARRKLAMELREAGLCYRDIAVTLNQKGYKCTLTTAYKDVKAALAETHDRTVESAERHIQTEINRLNTMLKSIWAKVLRGEVTAIDRALKIGERRAKLLGLDAPTRIDQMGTSINIDIDSVEDEDRLAKIRQKIEETKAKLNE